MTNLDAFSSEIVRLVRAMPDAAILALVKNQLGAVVDGSNTVSFPASRMSDAQKRHGSSNGAGGPKSARSGRSAQVAARPAKGKARRAAKTSKPRANGGPARIELLAKIERIVKTSSGVSASEVARAAGAPQPRAAAALKELKASKRIFQGGDRRFARYAGDARTADAASQHARTHASGPRKKPGKTK
jgi:hypothetical protein